MLSHLLHELSLVPMWALLILINLAAAVGCAVWIIHDPDSRSVLGGVLVACAFVVIAAAVGTVLAFAFGGIYLVESLVWRANRPTPPARRIH